MSIKKFTFVWDVFEIYLFDRIYICWIYIWDIIYLKNHINISLSWVESYKESHFPNNGFIWYTGTLASSDSSWVHWRKRLTLDKTNICLEMRLSDGICMNYEPTYVCSAPVWNNTTIILCLFHRRKIFLKIAVSHHILSQEKEDEAQQNLNGVTEILKFGASIVEGFIALMGQKVILLDYLNYYLII